MIGYDIAEIGSSDVSLRRFRVELGDACGYFEGHFPGHPVLPAVAQLEIVADSIRRSGFPRAEIVAIDALRLNRPLGPGDAFDLAVKFAAPSGSAHFEIRHRESVVSSGVVAWTELPE